MAVSLTLPHGIERTKAVRSGASGSAIGTPRPEWQCHPHCHSTLNVWGAVRSGPTGSVTGTLRADWQCYPHGTARSGPSGSVTHTATWHRAYQSGTLRGEWQCDRYARGRVAVLPTLPLDVERVGVIRSVPTGSATGTFRTEWQCDRYAQGRVAVRVGVTFGSVGVMPTSERLDRGVPQTPPGTASS